MHYRGECPWRAAGLGRLGGTGTEVPANELGNPGRKGCRVAYLGSPYGVLTHVGIEIHALFI